MPVLNTIFGKRKRRGIENNSLCTVGPLYIRSFNDKLVDDFADASKFTPRVVVLLSGFNTQWWGMKEFRSTKVSISTLCYSYSCINWIYWVQTSWSFSSLRSILKNLLFAIAWGSPNAAGFSRNGRLTIKRLSTLAHTFGVKCDSHSFSTDESSFPTNSTSTNFQTCSMDSNLNLSGR